MNWISLNYHRRTAQLRMRSTGVTESKWITICKISRINTLRKLSCPQLTSTGPYKTLRSTLRQTISRTSKISSQIFQSKRCNRERNLRSLVRKWSLVRYWGLEQRSRCLTISWSKIQISFSKQAKLTSKQTLITWANLTHSFKLCSRWRAFKTSFRRDKISLLHSSANLNSTTRRSRMKAPNCNLPTSSPSLKDSKPRMKRVKMKWQWI